MNLDRSKYIIRQIGLRLRNNAWLLRPVLVAAFSEAARQLVHHWL